MESGVAVALCVAGGHVAIIERYGILAFNDYNRRYDEMVSRYEATKAERDALAAEIRQRGIRRREFERFITTLESLPDQVTDFDETLWGSLAVYAKGDLRFMLACEVEITA